MPDIKRKVWLAYSIFVVLGFITVIIVILSFYSGDEKDLLFAGAVSGIYATLMIMLFILSKKIISYKKRKKEAMVKQVNHDLQTGLPNRNYFIEYAEKLLTKAMVPFSLFFLELDNFKYISDTIDRFEQDMLLIEIAGRLKEFEKTDLKVFRISNNEFCMLSYNDTISKRTPENIAGLNIGTAQQIINRVTEPYKINGIELNIIAHIGISRYPEHGYTPEELIQAAGFAIKEAKRTQTAASLFTGKMEI